jgi:uncharacterized protein
VADGYDNFVSRIGLQNDNTLSGGTYAFDLTTRNRVLLEAAYRGSWIVGKVIDAPAEDMTRAGIDINTTEGEKDLPVLRAQISRLQIWNSLRDNEKWGRLYGGSVAVMDIAGQDLSTPLKPSTVGKGQFRGLLVFDRWMLNPVLTPVIKSGPDIGLPMFYQIVNNPQSYDPTAATDTGQLTVHHSRVIRSIGHKLPFFQAITEMMWGESCLERLWDRLIAFDNATMSTGQLVDKAHLRTVSIEGLREIIAAGGEAYEGLLQQFAAMRFMQDNEGLTLLDKNDEYEATVYTFAGLPDVLLQFAQQLSGASDIPLVRLFAQSPSGLNATGDSDLRMYYDNVRAWQEAKFRRGWEMILRVMWRSTFGRARPKDLEFSFTPLWQMTQADKATIGKTNTDSILAAHGAALVPTKTAMLELRGMSADTGIFSNITDEDIEAAGELEPPMPDVAPEESMNPEPKNDE